MAPGQRRKPCTLDRNPWKVPRELQPLDPLGAKSVFHFDVPGQVAHATHAALPWLRFIRRELGDRVYFRPFDEWQVPSGRSAVVEVCPSLKRHEFSRGERTGDQHDAFCIASWLSRTDGDETLGCYLRPPLKPREVA